MKVMTKKENHPSTSGWAQKPTCDDDHSNLMRNEAKPEDVKGYDEKRVPSHQVIHPEKEGEGDEGEEGVEEREGEGEGEREEREGEKGEGEGEGEGEGRRELSEKIRRR